MRLIPLLAALFCILATACAATGIDQRRPDRTCPGFPIALFGDRIGNLATHEHHGRTLDILVRMWYEGSRPDLPMIPTRAFVYDFGSRTGKAIIAYVAGDCVLALLTKDRDDILKEFARVLGWGI